ncbi:MAG TPA: VTC domain-containing protein, partial [Gemmataceae bacterium]|nr:VTC domain-containing protein [Gemmataceae bacterium]
MDMRPTVDSASPLSTSSVPISALGGDAYEVKFRLTFDETNWVETWARERLTPDPHGDNGVYRTTSLYVDTPFFDIYHKTRGYRRSKYRLRRYGSMDWVHLERKLRRGDRVRKRRDMVPLADISSLASGINGGWFGERVRERLFQPVCWIAYTRTAFQSATPTGPLRLTLDRDVVGAPAPAWTVPAGVDGRALLP